MPRGKTYALSRGVTDLPELSGKPGTYCIISVNKSGKPKRVHRVGGIDKHGIVYYGRSGNLRSRLRTLHNMLFKGSASGHIAGHHYRASKVLKSVFPRDTLYFRFKHCSSKEGATKAEFKLLGAYCKQFGEVPPLNTTGALI